MAVLQPCAQPNQSIGLLGGSFDPPHQGHLHISAEALKRFRLSQIWWLITPKNPQKNHEPAHVTLRVAQAQSLVSDPRIVVTDLESQLGTQLTAETLQKLVHLHRRTRFVWLMGADNFASFHQWYDWRWILAHVRVGVFARPGSQMPAQMSVAARVFRTKRVLARGSHLLASKDPPAWCYLNAPLISTSSRSLRKSQTKLSSTTPLRRV